jgi:hypothetical protein
MSTYCLLSCSSGRKVEDLHRYRCLCGHEPCYFLPALDALDHLLSIGRGAKEVASRAEVLSDGPIGGEEPLRPSGRFEALHTPLLLARRLMGILRTVVEVAVLAMFDAGQDFPLRGAVALELIEYDDPGHILAPFEGLRKNFFAAFLLRRLCTRISSTWPS